MSNMLRPLRVEKSQSHEGLYLMGALLSDTADPELGLFPTMTVRDNGIFITREEEDFLVLTYSFQAGEHSREQLEELASQVLRQRPVDNEFLINNGFKQEYGARANMRKSRSISPHTTRTLRRTRHTHSQGSESQRLELA
jgi:hypothetical protein